MVKYIVLTAVLFASTSISATSLDTKIAASFAAKYEVCGYKLKDAKFGSGYRIKAKVSRDRASDMSRERLFEKGYVKTLEKEKKKIWRNWSKQRCKKFIDERLDE
jgi:hypothetical protein